MRPFEPIVANAHAATILGNFWPRHLDCAAYPVEDRYFDTAPGVKVLARLQRPGGQPKGTLVLVHGLESSSEAGYILSMTQASLERGYAVCRVNLRSCGGTAHLCSTLYHAGLTVDVRYIVERLREEGGGPIFTVGYSLGGNVVLKLAAELGASDLLQGTVAVSTPIDLEASVEAMERGVNRFYDRRFLKRMQRRLRVYHQRHPKLFSLEALNAARSVREFDDRITAPSFGFQGAVDYYRTQSAVYCLNRIARPALLITASDDPLVPSAIYSHPNVTGNPNIRVHMVDHGGHLGFISRRKPRIWLDAVLLDWIEKTGNN